MQSYAKPHTAVRAVLISAHQQLLSLRCLHPAGRARVINRLAADEQRQAEADVEALEMVAEGMKSFNESYGNFQNCMGYMSLQLDGAVTGLQVTQGHMHQALQYQLEGCRSLDQVEHGFQKMLSTARGRADRSGTHRR